MSNGQWAISGAKTLGTIRPKRRIRKAKKMKLTLKQRLRNWLNDDNDQADYISQDVVETAQLESDGLRLQVYKASGGYVVETRSYDRRKDQNNNSIHVITDEEDLGDRIGKIIMMEALKG
jgi:uncharacterized membrane protein YcaP (DUF421 family)